MSIERCSLCQEEIQIDIKKDIKIVVPDAPIFYSCRNCIPYLEILLDFEEEKVQWH